MYYYNPQKQQNGTYVARKLSKTIEECLKSEAPRIRRFCKKHRLTAAIFNSMLIEFCKAGVNGVSNIGQQKIADRLGISLRSLNTYYRGAVSGGFLYSNHRTRTTKRGDKWRTTNITAIRILFDYCERCAKYIRDSLNTANKRGAYNSTLNATVAPRIVFNTATGEILPEKRKKKAFSEVVLAAESSKLRFNQTKHGI